MVIHTVIYLAGHILGAIPISWNWGEFKFLYKHNDLTIKRYVIRTPPVIFLKIFTKPSIYISITIYK